MASMDLIVLVEHGRRERPGDRHRLSTDRRTVARQPATSPGRN